MASSLVRKLGSPRALRRTLRSNSMLSKTRMVRFLHLRLWFTTTQQLATGTRFPVRLCSNSRRCSKASTAPGKYGSHGVMLTRLGSRRHLRTVLSSSELHHPKHRRNKALQRHQYPLR